MVFGLMILCLGVMSLGTYFIFRSWRFLSTPPEEAGREISYIVEPGMTLTAAARELASLRLITDAERFVALAEARNKTSGLKAGEFMLRTDMVPEALLRVLTSTRGVERRLTVREGLTWWETGRLVEEAGLGSAESFREAVHDPALLEKYRIPARDAEGYLYPQTYLLSRNRKDDARPVAEAMLKEFFKVAKEVFPGGPPEPKKLHELVILASIAERETGELTERARVAGVFVNRLKARMLLQTDPSVIYGLGERFDGDLVKDDLQDRKNPYNTYVLPGLPPGPICSPGRHSLKAAAFPEEHKFYYFVAKGDGTHEFTTNLDDHNRAVFRYQLRRDKANYKTHK